MNMLTTALLAYGLGALTFWFHHTLREGRAARGETPLPRWVHALCTSGMTTFGVNIVLIVQGIDPLSSVAVMLLGIALWTPVMAWDWRERGMPPPANTWARDIGVLSAIAAITTGPMAFFAVLSVLSETPSVATRFAITMMVVVMVAAVAAQLLVPRTRTMLLAPLTFTGNALAVTLAVMAFADADGRTFVLLACAVMVTSVVAIMLTSFALDLFDWWNRR